MNDKQKTQDLIYYAIEISIRLGLLFLIIAWCFKLIYPFTEIVIWSIILALALSPLYNGLNKRLGDKPKVTASIIVIIGLTIIIVPTWLFLDSAVDGIKEFSSRLSDNSLTIPPPTERVAGWPLIGTKVYDLWLQLSVNLTATLAKYQTQITKFSQSMVDSVLTFGATILQFVISIIIAGVFLATKGTEQASRKFFKRLVGDRGDEFADVAIKTVGNVTKGILGVAVIQAFLVGIGLLLAGIPYAGIWTLIVLVLAILQLPATIVSIPAAIYLFSVTGTVPAILWTVYLLVAGISDNILKPILLGKGAPVPLLVIFLGVIGGFILSGFIGLFTGAIMLSIGYKLFIYWLNDVNKVAEDNPAA